MTTEDESTAGALLRSAGELNLLGTLTLELWQRTRIDWGFVTDRLADAFRARRLGSRERRIVAETLFGMVRHARRIDEALSAGGERRVSAAPDVDRLLAYLVLETGLSPDEAARHRPGLDWRAVAAIDDGLEAIRDPAQRIARRHSLPDWLAGRLVADWGEEAGPLAASLNARAPMTLRANPLRSDPDGVVEALADEGIRASRSELASSALQLATRTNVFSLRAFRDGLFEVQDEGSQLIAELVAPPPKGLVVDLCAGAGGKTLALAAALENRGRILAVDIDGRKLKELRRRARRAGASNVQAVELSPDPRAALPAPLARVEGRVDRVLVDAPCTGVGALRRNPEAKWRLGEADADRLPDTQRAICERGLSLLAPGGRLIYATCTVLSAENQQVVRDLAAAHPELEIVPPKEIWGRERAAELTDASGSFLEVLPHRHGTDGFFAAILRLPKT